MEVSSSNLSTHNYISPLLTCSLSSTKLPIAQWVPPKSTKKTRAGIRCGKNTSLMVELERELAEIKNEGREWREMKNCCENGSSSTSLELLECLEREAIMGDDEGREPTDYNRRAQIFDKSSKVFQALKQLRSSS